MGVGDGRGRGGVEGAGRGQERLSGFLFLLSPLSTFICRAIVLCLFNTSTV